MAKRTWILKLEDGDHIVHLDHNYWSTRRIITLDNRVIDDETPINNLRHEYEFGCAGHAYKVTVGRSYLVLTVSYTLTVDGIIIEPLEESKARPSLDNPG